MRRQRSKQLCNSLMLLLICGAVFAAFQNATTFKELQKRLPKVSSLNFGYDSSLVFDETKVALLIEDRPLGVLAPLLVHFIGVLPKDWSFQFMGSQDSVRKVNASAAMRQHVASGKLRLTYIPSNMTVAGQEEISQFLTNRWVIEQLLQPAEWLLLFQADSIVCTKSPSTLNTWLHYSWIGAPWYDLSPYGGNGGLSLRHLPTLLRVLTHQSRPPDSEPEDMWFTERLSRLPNPRYRVANGTEAMEFSVENIWFDEPLGLHVGRDEFLRPNVFAFQGRRDYLWRYCPEVKVVLEMETAVHMPVHCSPWEAD